MNLYEDLGTLTVGEVGTSDINKRIQNAMQRSYPRTLEAIGLSGSTAAGDAGFEWTAGDRLITTVYNEVTDEHFRAPEMQQNLGAYIPPKSIQSMEVVDAFEADAHGYWAWIEQIRGQTIPGAEGKFLTSGELVLINLGTMALDKGDGMQKTKEGREFRIDEENDRWIANHALVKGTAAMDAQISVDIDGEVKGTLWNTQTTLNIVNDTLLPAYIYVPMGEPVDVSCLNAMASDTYWAAHCYKVAYPRQ